MWVISNFAPPYGAPLLKIVEDMVDGYTLSYLHGVVKPDPEIYAKACEGLGLSPHEVLMVGDHAKNDVAGARAIGMSSVLVPDGGITMAWLKNMLL